MEVGGIVNEKIDNKYISAEIIYLATKGYIKIRQFENEIIGPFKSTDYEIIKLKNFNDVQNNFDRKILEGLFDGGYRIKGDKDIMKVFKNHFMTDLKKLDDILESNPSLDSVNLSSLRDKFYTSALSAINLTADALLSMKYYKNLGRIKANKNNRLDVFFIVVFQFLFIAVVLGSILWGKVLPPVLSVTFSLIILLIIWRLSPAKTEKGIAARDYLLGLKEYLQIAEKNRLEFHNAPEKKPEIFEKLLPYAMVLGVSKIWAKEFEDIYTTPPSWYSGSGDMAFSALAFSDSLSSFSSSATSSLVSSPSSSGGSGSSFGSGGGGFSGGGGGGGGGSW